MNPGAGEKKQSALSKYFTQMSLKVLKVGVCYAYQRLV